MTKLSNISFNRKRILESKKGIEFIDSQDLSLNTGLERVIIHFDDETILNTNSSNTSLLTDNDILTQSEFEELNNENKRFGSLIFKNLLPGNWHNISVQFIYDTAQKDKRYISGIEVNLGKNDGTSFGFNSNEIKFHVFNIVLNFLVTELLIEKGEKEFFLKLFNNLSTSSNLERIDFFERHLFFHKEYSSNDEKQIPRGKSNPSANI